MAKSFLEGIGKGFGDFVSGVQSTPKARQQWAEVQKQELQLDTMRMQRWLQIAKDPGYSRNLRINALKKAFETKSGKSLLNATGVELNDDWANQSIDTMDMYNVNPNKLIGQTGGDTRWSYNPSTGVRLYGGGAGKGQFDKLIDLETKYENEENDTIKEDLLEQIDLLRGNMGKRPYKEKSGETEKSSKGTSWYNPFGWGRGKQVQEIPAQGGWRGGLPAPGTMQARPAQAELVGPPVSLMTKPTTTPSAVETPTKELDKETAMEILKEAGGDKEKARRIAKERGYKF